MDSVGEEQMNEAKARQPGYYWVRPIAGYWAVALYLQDGWYCPRYTIPFGDDAFSEIKEQRLELPEELVKQ